MDIPRSSGAVDLAPSFVRTAVPLIVGPLIARYGFDADDPTVSVVISAVVSYVYYVIVRVLELKAPTLGYLLGIAKQPTYVTPPAVVIDEGGARAVGPEPG
jgi:uncharacterized membrane protein YcaP (DUF421 family)